MAFVLHICCSRQISVLLLVPVSVDRRVTVHELTTVELERHREGVGLEDSVHIHIGVRHDEGVVGNRHIVAVEVEDMPLCEMIAFARRSIYRDSGTSGILHWIVRNGTISRVPVIHIAHRHEAERLGCHITVDHINSSGNGFHRGCAVDGERGGIDLSARNISASRNHRICAVQCVIDGGISRIALDGDRHGLLGGEVVACRIRADDRRGHSSHICEVSHKGTVFRSHEGKRVLGEGLVTSCPVVKEEVIIRCCGQRYLFTIGYILFFR